MARRALALLYLLLLAGGCATAGASSGQSAETRRTDPPRVRCLNDPGRDAASGSRPLFFLFCVESP